MRSSEKKGIILLIAISVVIIILLNVFSKKNESKQEVAQAGENAQNVQTENISSDVQDVSSEKTEENGNTQIANQEDEYKIEKLKGIKMIEGMRISNINIEYQYGLTKITGDVENTTNSNQGGFVMSVNLINNQGEKIATLPAYIPEIKPGEKTQMKTSDIKDLTGTYDILVSRQNKNN